MGQSCRFLTHDWPRLPCLMATDSDASGIEQTTRYDTEGK